uniref:Protein FAM32A-like n=1 Tax=Schistosoma japonicum TaxID=6182 RepID=C1LPJ0_SCHJA|nr:Protein FAM32A-like [Schistosoma japonicum]
MSDYDEVLCSSLKLKSGQGIKKKKKKHSKKVASNDLEVTVNTFETNSSVETIKDIKNSKPTYANLTKSQMEWEKRRDKRILESVLSKADKSHKQRIIEFNNYLSTLTEHFDIQKVSWTK